MARDFLGLPLVLYYPGLAFVLLVLVVAFVPRRRIKELFVEGLVFGTLFSFLFDMLLTLLGVFRYAHQGPYSLFAAPIWLNFAWSPAMLMFLHFKPPMKRGFLFWIYLSIFCLLSAMLDESLDRLGLLHRMHWSVLTRFAAAFPWFLSAALFREKYMERLEQPSGR